MPSPSVSLHVALLGQVTDITPAGPAACTPADDWPEANSRFSVPTKSRLPDHQGFQRESLGGGREKSRKYLCNGPLTRHESVTRMLVPERRYGRRVPLQRRPCLDTPLSTYTTFDG